MSITAPPHPTSGWATAARRSAGKAPVVRCDGAGVTDFRPHRLRHAAAQPRPPNRAPVVGSRKPDAKAASQSTPGPQPTAADAGRAPCRGRPKAGTDRPLAYWPRLAHYAHRGQARASVRARPERRSGSSLATLRSHHEGPMKLKFRLRGPGLRRQPGGRKFGEPPENGSSNGRLRPSLRINVGLRIHLCAR